jgi:hypothetical protein
LEYFAVNEIILCPFGILCGHLIYLSSFGMFYQEKSGNPGQKFAVAKCTYGIFALPKKSSIDPKIE